MSADCQHWQDTGHPHAGHCAVAGKTVSAGVCAACLRDGLRGKHLVAGGMSPAESAARAAALGIAYVAPGRCAGCGQ